MAIIIFWRWFPNGSATVVGDKATGCWLRSSLTMLSSLLLGFLFASLVAFNRWFKLYPPTSSHIPFLFLHSWASACLSPSTVRSCRSRERGDYSLISTRTNLINLWLVRSLRFWPILNLLFSVTWISHVLKFFFVLIRTVFYFQRWILRNIISP